MSALSFVSSIKYGAQMKTSANSSLFTTASETLALDLGGSDPTLALLKIEGTLNAAQLAALNAEIAAKASRVYKAVNVPVAAAKFNGGRNTTAPQKLDYFNARTATGAKVYSDPEASYRAAVENFVNETSMTVDPRNGKSLLTSSLISVSDSSDGIDIALIPGNEYRVTPGSDSLQCAFGQSCVIGGDFVIKICPGNVSTLLANPILSKTMSTNNVMTTHNLTNRWFT
jgi:hypothetical protein